MNELTIEEQRVLTEALGEKWCKHNRFHVASPHQCIDCGEINYDRLDFEDGRVTMRLMELVDLVSVERVFRGDGFYARALDDTTGIEYGATSSIKEIAIAKAVYAYIVAKEK